MPTIGLDCMVILDGNGYWIDPESFSMTRPRVRRADLNKIAATTSGGYGVGAGERYVDLGPGKREWAMIVQCFQAMRDYAGNTVTTTGQQFRTNLHTSYEKIATPLSFTEPGGHTYSVHFDALTETIAQVRAQVDAEALQFHVHILLIEA